MQEVAEALALQLGPTFTARTKQKLVRTMDPDLDKETLDEIDAELDETPEPQVGGEQDLRALLQQRSQQRLTPLLEDEPESPDVQ